jgi:aryl-alcohol dehydrogenase-like predicted oxidoreductase
MSEIDTADEFKIGGDLCVRKLGFGAMRLTGKGVWGPPEDVPAAQAVLCRAVELGINFIDTAGSYGPGDNERLIRDTLRPYPIGLVIGTKGGMRKTGPSTPASWGIELDAGESFLRQGVEGSLRDLGVERIDLYQLHRVDPKVPIEDTMGVLARLQDDGKIRHVGLSAVDVEQIERARSVIDIATVQNEYNLASRKHEDILTYCEQHAIGFIPFYPQQIGKLAEAETLRAIGARENATPAMVALAWLLRRSPVMIPIPGTSSRAHLEENVDACRIALSEFDMAALEALATQPVEHVS